MNITEQEVREVLERIACAHFIGIDHVNNVVHVRRVCKRPMLYSISRDEVEFRNEGDPIQLALASRSGDYVSEPGLPEWRKAVREIISILEDSERINLTDDEEDGLSDAAAVDLPGMQNRITFLENANTNLKRTITKLQEQLGNVDEAEIRVADITQQILGIDAKLADLFDQKTELNSALMDAKIREFHALSEAQQ